MKKIRNFLRDRDDFGHPVVLNFNRNGDTFTTVIGGCLSMLVNIIMVLFFVYKSWVLIYNQNDSIGLSREITDFEGIGKMSMN